MLHTLALAAAPLSLAACVIVVEAAPSDGEFGLDAGFASQGQDRGQDRGQNRGQGQAEAGEMLAAEATLAPFDAVEASAGPEVVLRPGEAFTITLDEDARRRAAYEVADGTLTITCRRREGWGRNCVRGDRGTLTVTLPEARALRVTSGASLTLTEGVALADELSVAASSGASFRAKGAFPAVERLDVKASSGASIRAEGLSGQRGDIRASSGASVRLGDLTQGGAKASSGASVTYEGEGGVEQSVSSGGSVRRR